MRWLWRRVRWGQRRRWRAALDVTYWRGTLFLKGTAIHQGLTSFPNADDSGADDEGSLIMLLARLIKPSQVSGRAPAALQGEGRGGTGLGSRRASASSQLRPWVRPGVLAWTRRTRRGAQAVDPDQARGSPRTSRWLATPVTRPRRPRHSRVTRPGVRVTSASRAPGARVTSASRVPGDHVTCPRRPRHQTPASLVPASAPRSSVTIAF